jgi:hypothetical protein
MLDQSDMLSESDMRGELVLTYLISLICLGQSDMLGEPLVIPCGLCRHKELDVHFCAESLADEAHSEDTML